MGEEANAFKEEANAFRNAHPEVDAVEFRCVDALGIARGKWAPVSVLSKAYGEGIAFPMSMLGLDRWGREVEETGLHIASGDLDGLYYPIGPPCLATWTERPTAVVQLAGRSASGKPHPSDPRHALARVVERFAARRLSPVCAFELEFHLFMPGTVPPEPAMAGNREAGPPGVADQSMYDDRALDGHRPVWDAIRRAADSFALPIDTIVSEAGPGQFEINLAHGPAMDAADHAVALRHIVTACAAREGLQASFMAKPMSEEAGNGCHIHCSLVDEAGRNAFAADPALLPHAIAGLIEHMPASTLGLVGSWNGFRRMASGSYAPTRAVWGENNRSVAVRVPMGEDNARRFEHRTASADSCPYVVAALVLAAALDGMEREAVPPAPLEGNAYDGTGAELPTFMGEAMAAHRASAFVSRALGDVLARNLGHMLEAEHAALSRAIPSYEHATFL